MRVCVHVCVCVCARARVCVYGQLVCVYMYIRHSLSYACMYNCLPLLFRYQRQLKEMREELKLTESKEQDQSRKRRNAVSHVCKVVNRM